MSYIFWKIYLLIHTDGSIFSKIYFSGIGVGLQAFPDAFLGNNIMFTGVVSCTDSSLKYVISSGKISS